MRKALALTGVCLLISAIIQEIHSKALTKKENDAQEVAALNMKEDLENKNSVKVSKRTLNHLITGLIGLLININPPPASAAATEEDEE